MSERGVPIPVVPHNAFVASVQPIVGESFIVACGLCQCNEDRDERNGKFWLRAGEQWRCPECGRIYTFDGERIDVREQDLGTGVDL